jgi:hypothetical protein
MAVPSSSIESPGEYGKLLKANYTKPTMDKIKVILSKDKLLKVDTCTTVMQRVVKKLCGVDYTTATESENAIALDLADGVYTLVLNFGKDINSGGDIQFWEHGLAFQKIGHEIILYQGWVEKFTLSAWLTGTSIGTCHRMLPYSPANCIGNAIETFIQQIKDLGAALERCRDNEEFIKTLYTPFMEYRSTDRETRILLMRGTGLGKLKYHWKYFPFKN